MMKKWIAVMMAAVLLLSVSAAIAEATDEDRAAADAVAELIDAIYVQTRSENTDAQCAAAPAGAGCAVQPWEKTFRMAVARDEAFSFYYQANLDLLERMGMELVPFSPLRDERIPAGMDGLYLGGGFPEMFAAQLSANRGMRQSLYDALDAGLPCYAECGGLLYLSQAIDGVPMVGFLPAQCRITQRLQRFGYVQVTDRTGMRFPAHEFHYAVAEPMGDAHLAYTVRKASRPDKAWACGYEKKRTLGAFAHLHFLSHPEIVRRLWA